MCVYVKRETNNCNHGDCVSDRSTLFITILVATAGKEMGVRHLLKFAT